ncbi:hypothetical protein GNP66_09450 [Aliivibrio fischeri]|nr:hypothetical protein [Aliivibrio fischeri]
MKSSDFRTSKMRERVVKPLIVSAFMCGLIAAFANKYTLYYEMKANGCLHATLFLVTEDKDLHVGNLVTIAGKGVPKLPDKYNYTKMIGGLPGDTVSFDGMYITTSSGFKRYAPVPEEYYELKEKHNLQSSWIIPKGKVFLFGDSITSLDSRVVGLADINYVIGRTYALY